MPNTLSKSENILLIRLSSMGDVVLVFGAISWCFDHVPGAHITVCTKKAYAGLFEKDFRVHKVVVFENLAQSAEGELLRTTLWDRVVDLQNNHTTKHLLKSLKNVLCVKRFDKFHGHRLLLINFRLNIYGSSPTVLSRYATACGAKETDEIRLQFPLQSGYVFPASFNDWRKTTQPLLVLIPFTAWKNKEWPQKSYEAVGKAFVQRGYQIVILGSKKEKPQAELLSAALGNCSYSCAGEVDLVSCAYIMQSATLGLGGDTGLVHLGRSVGLRMGVIYGATTRHFGFYPQGNPPSVVFETPLVCRPCHPHGGNICYRITRPCLNRIKQDAVVDGLLTLMQ